jgi:hypothetical protein
MHVEGLGYVTRDILNKTRLDICIQGMVYYVPEAKACLLSPQRLFDPSAGLKGHYEGGLSFFRLCIVGFPYLIVEYDQKGFYLLDMRELGLIRLICPLNVKPTLLCWIIPTKTSLLARTPSSMELSFWAYEFAFRSTNSSCSAFIVFCF